MPLPATLFNSFNQGREKLEMSSAVLNQYAKWMQSPNIPRSVRLPIALENIESTIENDPTVDEWLSKLESNTRKTQKPVPLFFPRNYHSSQYYSTEFKGEDRWINAILSGIDHMFPIYSDSSKDKTQQDLKTKATTMFHKLFDADVYRLYKEKKPEIYSSLFRNTTPAGLHIFSNVVDKNIIVLRDYGYEWCSYVSKERDTLCLWEKEGDMGVLIDSQQNGNIDITDILRSKTDLFEKRTNKIKIASNKETLQRCRELTKKTVEELQKKSEEKGLEISGEDGKKLRKQELIDNLLDMF